SGDNLTPVRIGGGGANALARREALRNGRILQNDGVVAGINLREPGDRGVYQCGEYSYPADVPNEHSSPDVQLFYSGFAIVVRFGVAPARAPLRSRLFVGRKERFEDPPDTNVHSTKRGDRKGARRCEKQHQA